MQCTTDNVQVEVSSITKDAIENLASAFQKTTEEFAAFLLRRGFSNLKKNRVIVP